MHTFFVKNTENDHKNTAKVGKNPYLTASQFWDQSYHYGASGTVQSAKVTSQKTEKETTHLNFPIYDCGGQTFPC